MMSPRSVSKPNYSSRLAMKNHYRIPLPRREYDIDLTTASMKELQAMKELRTSHEGASS